MLDEFDSVSIRGAVRLRMLAMGYEPLAWGDWECHELERLPEMKERNFKRTQIQFNIGAAGRTDYYEATSRLAVPKGLDAGDWI